MKNSFKLVAILLLSSLFIQCKKEEEKDNSISYSKTIVPILEKNCYLCHSAAPLDIRVYDNVAALAKSGMLVGVITGASGYKLMPPTGAIPASDIDKIKQWVTEGAKNN